METSNTQELLARRTAAVATSAGTAHPLFVSEAHGSEVIDVDGKRYIDFASGIAVTNLGHRHPGITRAIQNQLAVFAHVGFPVNAYEPYIAVCEQLNRVAPIEDPRSVLFTTGAEAIENAIKVARIFTGRIGVVAFAGSFHGRTQLAAALTGKTQPIRSGVPPLQAGIFHMPFPGPEVSEEAAIDALEQLFRVTVAPDQIAAILFEPVQGEGGFHQAPPRFVRHLRRLCDEHGICLVVDEIQSGFGRTGRFFAIEHYDVRPDVIAVGKAIGGGLPLSGIVGRSDIMNKPVPGALGGTFAGSPVACAAALAVFAALESPGLMQRAEHIGRVSLERLSIIRAAQSPSVIGDIRQLGAMVAFDIVEADSRRPDPATTKILTTKARQAGVLFLPCGMFGSTVRLSAALTMTDAILNEGLDRLTSVLMNFQPASRAS